MAVVRCHDYCQFILRRATQCDWSRSCNNCWWHSQVVTWQKLKTVRLVNRAAETCNFHNRLCWCRLFDTAIAAVVLPYASKIIAIGARKAHCRYEAVFIIISEEFDERLSVTLVSRYFRCCSTDAGETYPTSFVAAGLGVETLRSKLFQTHPNPKPLTSKFLSSPFTIRARFFLLFGFNMETLPWKGQKGTTREPRP